MPRQTPLDTQWNGLMALCESEARLRAAQTLHPKLLKLLESEIRDLARQMGFSDRQIRTREFRAERVQGRIVRVIADGRLGDRKQRGS